MTSLYPAETNNGVVTSWIPLTTIYTPSAGCSTEFRLNGPSLVAFDPGYGLDIDPSVVCAPPAVTTWWEQGRLGQGADPGHTAASIGPLTCPRSWTTVATSVKGGISTNIMCCPPGYTLANGIRGSIAGDCRSTVSSGMVVTFASTPLGDSTAWETATATITEDSIVGAIAVVGWNIKQPTPTPSSSSSSSSSPSLSTPTPTSSPSATFTPTSSAATATASASSSSSTTTAGLSTGAAIGIGLGVALGVIGIVALLVAVWLMRRRKDKAAAAAAGDGARPAEPPSQPKEDDLITWEPHELHHDGVRPELYAHHVQRPPVELYAG